jgi:hypothetical protein
MILNIGNEILIDIDKVSAIHKNLIICDGARLGFNFGDIKIITEAFVWKNKDHMYDKEMKRMGEN